MIFDNSFAMFSVIASINHAFTLGDLLGPVPLQRAQGLTQALKLYEKGSPRWGQEPVVRLTHAPQPVLLDMYVVHTLGVKNYSVFGDFL